jgi:hypothetical protein
MPLPSDTSLLGKLEMTPGVCTVPRSVARKTRLKSAVKLVINIAAKTKYMVMPQDQNGERNHSMQTDNSSFERLEEFKYLETTLAKSKLF